MEDPAAIAPGTVLGERYRLESLLGCGAFGAVYCATTLPSGPRVALKVVAPRALQSTGGAARLQREAELASRLAHPSSVRVLGSGADGRGWLFIAFELLEGRTLEALLAGEGPLPPARAAAIVVDVLGALEEAHARGIVHRDIKPANVFLARTPLGEVVKVLDFGLAKSTNPGTRAGLTQAGAVLGTPLYMAPEQCSGEPVTPSTDLFALGVVLAELLYGRPIYDETAPMKLLIDRVSGVPTPIPAVVRASPLGPVIERATAADPAARFASASEMGAAIQSVAPLVASSGRLFATPATTPALEAAAPAASSHAIRPTAYDEVRSATLAAARGVTPGAWSPALATAGGKTPRGGRTAVVAVGAAIALIALAAGAWVMFASARSSPRPRDSDERADDASELARASRSESTSRTSSPPTPQPPTPAPVDFYADAMPILAIRRRDIPPGEIEQITITRDEADIGLTAPDDPSKRGLYIVSGGRGSFHHEISPGASCPIDLDATDFAGIPRMIRDAPKIAGATGEIVRVIIRCAMNERRATLIFVDIGRSDGTVEHEVEYDAQGRVKRKR